ncbi:MULTISPECIES: hypothetical protein [unclassified Novosphingobium]|uniref:hypothetical protein n=1 Tax=unclassified Novosphingobium TaxID=2644732 RepID=UPI00145A3356|nr:MULTISPECIES: hypothetical protein [unclassified Novosphingobium]MBB3356222.1 hypothetical protein [Novosphingobium sp. BK256]MBB3372623.1 hypothetical protein [Novosphingobium sp. BK280]MBB3376989.1 hypothetical protein [Novosphingobium sp. BK258]MBB3419598.1 hypothetical protein [Novosphingobium sp. BK267]MBB3448585.1 hypothetical protein [Novosphingobium sp. BK352]
MTFVARYHHVIDQIVAACPAPDKFAHTYAGMAIWTTTLALTRKRMGHALPLLMVIILESGNEVLDALYAGRVDIPDTLGDFLATCFWPAILFAVGRAQKR